MAARPVSDPVSSSSDESPEPDAADHPYLTEVGRRLLEERVRLLRQTAAELDEALGDAESRSEALEAQRRANRELARLDSVLRNARSVEAIPDDPNVVELGDRVVIGFSDGRAETYFLVDSAEAPVDDARISISSPLGRALLGRGVGDEVEVDAPAGSYRCTIVTARRS